MFDIGFAELLLIAVVGLLVLGPDRLPGAIRTASLWIGRIRRSFSSMKQEIEREIGADEIRRQLHNESVMASLEESKSQLNAAGSELRTLEQRLKSPSSTTNTGAAQAETDNATAAPAADGSPNEPPSAEGSSTSSKSE